MKTSTLLISSLLLVVLNAGADQRYYFNQIGVSNLTGSTISSLDVQHGFSLQPDNLNFQVLPGYVTEIQIQPTEAGEYVIVCNEYCGEGHHLMLGGIEVIE